MGAVAGGIASGQVPAGGEAGDPVDSWLNPTSLVTGVLAVVLAAYLAAVYLVWDAREAGETDLVGVLPPPGGAGRRRGRPVVAAVGLVVLRAEAPHVFDGLTSRALPLVILSVLCGVGALVLLVAGRRPRRPGARRRSRWPAIIVSWGVAQWPYLLPESLTVSAAAAPTGTLTALLVAVGPGPADRACPASCCSTSSTSARLLPDEDEDVGRTSAD